MADYIEGLLALFVLIMMLLHLVPGEGIKKYIRFFAGIVLAAGFLTPIFSVIYDSDEFLEKIDYETFTEQISEVSLDMQRMEYLQADHYRREYEIAIAEDVRQMTDKIAAAYGYEVSGADVSLSDDYGMEEIHLSLKPRDEERIMIGEIVLDGGKEGADDGGEKNGMTEELKHRLMEYYQVSEAQIAVTYT